ncbi:hypothetical protein CRG98_029567 [Punica granatum]|uniref:Uncharacterized protein n=1 Tax=Punica granatum TaxID=22663 RepID=A0A2I0J1D1_PUNGR|nr:hypothetical protein CRG98_029567 [Punica granatum]
MKVGSDTSLNSNPSLSALQQIFAGVVATYVNLTCYIKAPSNYTSGSWQIFSDIMMSVARNNKTMFQPAEWTLSKQKNYCKSVYGVAPRPIGSQHIMAVRDIFNLDYIDILYVHSVTRKHRQDIKLILQRFGSNIIFSNGLKDPFSSGGVLTNISGTIVAVYTAEGSHCLDIQARRTNVSDPDPYWLVKQR